MVSDIVGHCLYDQGCQSSVLAGIPFFVNVRKGPFFYILFLFYFIYFLFILLSSGFGAPE